VEKQDSAASITQVSADLMENNNKTGNWYKPRPWTAADSDAGIARWFISMVGRQPAINAEWQSGSDNDKTINIVRGFVEARKKSDKMCFWGPPLLQFESWPDIFYPEVYKSGTDYGSLAVPQADESLPPRRMVVHPLVRQCSLSLAADSYLNPEGISDWVVRENSENLCLASNNDNCIKESYTFMKRVPNEQIEGTNKKYHTVFDAGGAAGNRADNNANAPIYAYHISDSYGENGHAHVTVKTDTYGAGKESWYKVIDPTENGCNGRYTRGRAACDETERAQCTNQAQNQDCMPKGVKECLDGLEKYFQFFTGRQNACAAFTPAEKATNWGDGVQG